MSHRRKIAFVCAILVAFVIILLTAKTIADNSTHINLHEPSITASPDVTLKVPEPEIKAASEAKLSEPEPGVTTEPAPVAPSNIPSAPPASTYPYVPFYQVPNAQPQRPPTRPEPPLSRPIIPSPVQPLVPEVPRPVEGLLEPLAPVVDPLLDTVEDILPPLPSTVEVGIELENESNTKAIQPDQLLP